MHETIDRVGQVWMLYCNTANQCVVYITKSDVSKSIQVFIVLEGLGEGTESAAMDQGGFSWDVLAKVGIYSRLM